MYAMDFHMTSTGWDNSTRIQYSINQYVAWYLFAGIEQYVESIDMVPQCETLLHELERLRQWDEQHGGYYNAERYEALASRIRFIRALMERDNFRVVER